MEYAAYVDAIRREGAAVVTVANTAGVDAAVLSCPDWTIGDLLSHVGRIHRWVTDIIVTRAKPDQNWRMLDPPAPDARLGWFEEGYQQFADTLASTDPREHVWTWTPDQTVGFWARRQAHELVVHRWDAQTATGEPQPVDRALAVDGIQEVFDILPARPGVAPIRGTGETIHLHCTDGDGEWLLRMEPDALIVTNEHAKGDVAARGTASDLLLLVWGRIPPERVDVFGDASLLTRWQELTKF